MFFRRFATLLWIACMVLNACAQPVTVRISDRVLVEDTLPFGINSGMHDGYYDVQIRQSVVTCNFEGGLHRDIYIAYPFAAGKGRMAVDPRSAKRGLGPDRIGDYSGGRYTVVSGSQKWQEGTIRSIQMMKDGTNDRAVLEADPPLTDGAGAIMLHKVIPGEAHDGKQQGVRLEENCSFHFGDAAPGSFGQTSVRMDGRQGTALMRLFPGAQQRMDLNIEWSLRLRLKALEGTPNLRIHTEGNGEEKSLKPTSEWQELDLRFKVDGMPERPEDLAYLRFHLEVNDGVLLVDDIVLRRGDEKESGEFREVAVEAFKDAGMGIIRILQGANSTLEDTIRPRLQSRNGIGSLHEFYGFCDQVGAVAWYCLPATMTRQEMALFMEYLAAPADTPGGALRAELGRAEPWLDTLPGVIIEFGNEIYNFGGFGGADYWHDLIETGKASAWHRPEKIRFHMGKQGQALTHARNMDGFAMGGYLCWGFSKEGYEQYLSAPGAVHKWAAAASVMSVLDEQSEMAKVVRACREIGVEPAMYEGSFHINFGTGPSEPRNRMVTSLGGATSYTTHMLLKLKHFGMRYQCLFKDLGSGIQFSGTSAFGSEEAGYVRIWGNILRLDREESRFRPGWLALQVINQVIAGDLVATEHSREPGFSITAPMPWIYRDIRRLPTLEPTEFKDVPALHSFAFRDGPRRGLILVNLDIEETLTVRLEGIGSASTQARMWSLEAPSWSATNELDWEPDAPTVTIHQELLPQWRDGSTVELAPMQIRAIQWTAP